MSTLQPSLEGAQVYHLDPVEIQSSIYQRVPSILPIMALSATYQKIYPIRSWPRNYQGIAVLRTVERKNPGYMHCDNVSRRASFPSLHKYLRWRILVIGREARIDINFMSFAFTGAFGFVKVKFVDRAAIMILKLVFFTCRRTLSSMQRLRHGIMICTQNSETRCTRSVKTKYVRLTG